MIRKTGSTCAASGIAPGMFPLIAQVVLLCPPYPHHRLLPLLLLYHRCPRIKTLSLILLRDSTPDACSLFLSLSLSPAYLVFSRHLFMGSAVTLPYPARQQQEHQLRRHLSRRPCRRWPASGWAFR